MSMLSLQRGLDILSHFDSRNKSLSVQQLVERLDVPLSTLYRYLDILCERQFLTKDASTKHYSLGAVIHRLASVAGNELPVVAAATPFMESLVLKTNETVYLTVLINYRSVCAKKIESKRQVRLTIDEGIHQSLHAGASSRILLAYQTDHFIDQWLLSEAMPKITEQTICDPKKMREEIKQTRQRGYTVSAGETDEGAMAVAAPVFGSEAALRAGLSVAGPSERIAGHLTQLIEEVKATADEISKKLGYMPKPTKEI